jgi:hypothetical protein
MPRLSFREFKALQAQGVRFRPIWETERDAQGMPVRMWLAGWAEMPPRVRRRRVAAHTQPEKGISTPDGQRSLWEAPSDSTGPCRA